MRKKNVFFFFFFFQFFFVRGEAPISLLLLPLTGQRRRVELGDHVVVVGVEELGHVQGTSTLGPAGHREVLVEPGQCGEAGRGEAEVEGPVQDLVVEGPVKTDEGDSGVGLELPGGGLDVGGDLEELLLGDALLPVAVFLFLAEGGKKEREKERKKKKRR